MSHIWDIRRAGERAAQDIAASPATSATMADVQVIADHVMQEVTPIVDHITNNEPWYQSRVTWGVIVAGLATIAKPLVGELPLDAAQTADIVNALATAGQFFGFALTLYGRFRARKPIGT